MNIRFGTPDDAAAMQAIYAPYVEHTPITFEEDIPDVAEMRARIETVLRGHAFFVAEDGAGVFAYAYGAPYRVRSAYRHTAEVSVYVAREHVGQGTGTALYEVLMPWLTEHGFQSALGALTLPNDASVRLHEKVGFKKSAHFAQVGRKFGEWHDVGWWQKMLA